MLYTVEFPNVREETGNGLTIVLTSFQTFGPLQGEEEEEDIIQQSKEQEQCVTNKTENWSKVQRYKCSISRNKKYRSNADDISGIPLYSIKVKAKNRNQSGLGNVVFGTATFM